MCSCEFIFNLTTHLFVLEILLFNIVYAHLPLSMKFDHIILFSIITYVYYLMPRSTCSNYVAGQSLVCC